MNDDDRDQRTPDDSDPGPQAPAPGDPPADEAPTEPLGTTGSAQDPPDRRAAKLVRLRGDRVIGGVCAGMGRYFNVDPVLFRIAAVVLTFVGGAGVLLYLAALLLMPVEDSTTAGPVSGEGRNRVLVIVGVVALLIVASPFLLGAGFFLGAILIPLALLVAAGVLVWWLVSGEGPSGDASDIARRAALGIGVLILCGLVAVGGAWAAAAGGELVVALLVIGAGLAIAAGAFLKPVRWLVLPALTLALAAGAVAASGIDLDGGVGDRSYRPGSTAEVRDRYELGMGELTVDLRQADLPPGDTRIALDLGVGSARLVVPEGVCVATAADVGVGVVESFQEENGGVDVTFEDQRSAPPGTSRVLVDADVGVGEVRVGRSLLGDTRAFDFEDRHGGDHLGENDACDDA